jgi:hypothetical protein
MLIVICLLKLHGNGSAVYNLKNWGGKQPFLLLENFSEKKGRQSAMRIGAVEK